MRRRWSRVWWPRRLPGSWDTREPAFSVAARALRACASARRVQPGSSCAGAGSSGSIFARPIAGASRHGRDRVCDRRPDADNWVGRCLDGIGGAQGAGQDQAAPMIQVPTGVRVWLATGHTDMRKGFASLSLQVQEVLRRDPLCGHLFCFRGRRGNLLKVIWHDGQGACLFTKRLERGRFLWPSPADGVVTISPAQLGYLLSGIDWRHPQETWRPTSVG